MIVVVLMVIMHGGDYYCNVGVGDDDNDGDDYWW